MNKPDNPGVKGLPLQLWERTFFRPINRISKKRMPDTCHMDTDLMGPPGLKPATDIRIISKTLKYLIMGNRRLSVLCVDTHLLSVGWMPSDRRIDCAAVFFEIARSARLFDCAAVFFEIAMNDCLGNPLVNRMFFQLGGQALVSGVCFADN